MNWIITYTRRHTGEMRLIRVQGKTFGEVVLSLRINNPFDTDQWGATIDPWGEG